MSPLTAIITYLSLLKMWRDEGNNHSLQFITGIVLLISVGTFLYVSSIHILPEVFPRVAHDHPHNISRNYDESKSLIRTSIIASVPFKSD